MAGATSEATVAETEPCIAAMKSFEKLLLDASLKTCKVALGSVVGVAVSAVESATAADDARYMKVALQRPWHEVVANQCLAVADDLPLALNLHDLVVVESAADFVVNERFVVAAAAAAVGH